MSDDTQTPQSAAGMLIPPSDGDQASGRAARIDDNRNPLLRAVALDYAQAKAEGVTVRAWTGSEWREVSPEEAQRQGWDHLPPKVLGIQSTSQPVEVAEPHSSDALPDIPEDPGEWLAVVESEMGAAVVEAVDRERLAEAFQSMTRDPQALLGSVVGALHELVASGAVSQREMVQALKEGREELLIAVGELWGQWDGRTETLRGQAPSARRSMLSSDRHVRLVLNSFRSLIVRIA